MTASNDVGSMSRMSAGRVVAGVIFVIVFHIVAVFLLYGFGRQIVAAGLPGGFTVFVLPMMLSYLGYYLLLRAGKPRIIPCWVGAFLLTMLSLCLSLPLPFNVYGT
jgi:hypothetical protein